jgi:transcriptional regulator with XRE-family HTH domain
MSLHSMEVTLPTGHMLRAARALAGLKIAELAKLARIDASTISRMETSGTKPVRGQAGKVDGVIRALKAKGVEIDGDEGVVRLTRKPR